MAGTGGTALTDGAYERRLLVSAILLGVVGPEVFIVQPGTYLLTVGKLGAVKIKVK